MGLKCKSAGQTNGTIAMNLNAKLAYVDAVGHFGFLLTPSGGGNFAEVSCSFLQHDVIGGNGILGQVTAPPFGTQSETFTLAFKALSGHQEFSQINGTGTKYGLTAEVNGGSAESMTLEGSEAARINGGHKITFVP